MLPHMITVSNELPGYTIVENFGVVTGNAIRTRTLDNFVAWHLQSLLGARGLSYQKMSNNARVQAYEAMIEMAEEMGANAIIGLKYDSNNVVNGTAEILCYGSAVKAVKIKE